MFEIQTSFDNRVSTGRAEYAGEDASWKRVVTMKPDRAERGTVALRQTSERSERKWWERWEGMGFMRMILR